MLLSEVCLRAQVASYSLCQALSDAGLPPISGTGDDGTQGVKPTK